MKKVQHKHWYRQYIGECPSCGRGAGYRERIYGEKPKDPKEVYIYLDPDYCSDWCIY